MRREINREYIYSVAVYQKYLTMLGELKFSSLGELDIFDIRQHYKRMLFLFQRLICSVLLFLTSKNINLAVYENALVVEMTL